MVRPTDHLPFISVIIPVYRDAERLLRCLRALGTQTYPPDRFEVIVVDNEAAPGAPQYDARSAGLKGQLRVLFEAKVGAYAARNLGLRAAQGPLVAFTDADCVPVPGWLEAGARRWTDLQGRAVVAGDITLRFHGERPNAIELFDALFLGFPQRRFVEADHFGATANLFAAKDVFDRVGPFDERFLGGGDREWGQRAHAAGVPLVFEPEAGVAHEARANWTALSQKIRRNAGGAWLLHRSAVPPRSIGWICWSEAKRWRYLTQRLHAEGGGFPWAMRARLAFLINAAQFVRCAEAIRLFFGGRAARR